MYHMCGNMAAHTKSHLAVGELPGNWGGGGVRNKDRQKCCGTWCSVPLLSSFNSDNSKSPIVTV